MASDTKPPIPWRSVHKRSNSGMLYSEDVGPVGTLLDVNIVDSGLVKLRGPEGDTRMPWIGTGRGKKLGLNRTNCKVFETLVGTDDINQFRGWITLVIVRAKYPDKDTKQMLVTNAIRISPQRPQRPRPGAYRADGKDVVLPSTDQVVDEAQPSPLPDEQAEILRKEREGLS